MQFCLYVHILNTGNSYLDTFTKWSGTTASFFTIRRLTRIIFFELQEKTKQEVNYEAEHMSCSFT